MADVDFVPSATRIWIRKRYLLVTRIWLTLWMRQPDPTTIRFGVEIERDDVKISNQ